MALYHSGDFLGSLLLEDCPYMDLTVELLGIGDKAGALTCHAREDCVLAGVEEAAAIWERCGAKVETQAHSGLRVRAGEVFLRAEGSASALHRGLKVAQNLMEYLSGIATRTADMLALARAVQPDIHVAVTRKNFPGTKRLSLEAAVSGGARVHRLGLSETVLVFDQHRVFLDPPAQAGEEMTPLEIFARRVPALKKALPEKKLAAEVATREEAIRLAHAGLDIIQCEKFTPLELAATVREARAIRPDVVLLAAGGIRADNAAAFAESGVDELVTTWVYFGRPVDISVRVRRL